MRKQLNKRACGQKTKPQLYR